MSIVMETPMFLSEVRLQSAGGCPRVEQVHGAYFRLLGEADAGMAEDVHAAATKPFALGPAGRGADDKQWLVRFSAFGSKAERLCAAWREGAELRLGGEGARVLKNGMSSLGALNPAAEGEILALSFQTPTAFKCGDAHLPLPDPGLIFDSLERRLLAVHSPGDSSMGADAWRRIVHLRSHDIRSCVHRLKGHEIPGFVGRAFFGFDASARSCHVDLARRLAVFAEVAGVGVKTALGMGQTRLCR